MRNRGPSGTYASCQPADERLQRTGHRWRSARPLKRGVIYAKYVIDKYAPLMHTDAHENDTEHTGGPSEESGSTDGHSRKDIAGAFGA